MAKQEQNKNVKIQTELLSLVEGLNAGGEDWHDCAALRNNDIDKINDPEGATARKEVTSIPSPFARLHLAESAFRIVAVKSEGNLSYLDGDTIYHKIISDCLDLGEIFFNYDYLAKKHDLRIQKWNKRIHLHELKSGADKHRVLGETLSLFLDQDDPDSNFSRMENLYFLYLNGAILGGTSPSSLFFTSANKLHFAQLKQGNNTFFDQNYFPLYKRDISYLRYIYGLFQAYGLSNQFQSLWRYLSVNLKRLQNETPSAYDELKDIRLGDYTQEQFSTEFAAWNNDQIVEIFPDIVHLKKKEGEVKNSDFTIRTAKLTENIPLALQNGFQKKISYWGGVWNPATEVPFKNDLPLNERFLPGQDYQYPYLTVSDFLEPYLIQLPYHIDEMHFWTGEMVGFSKGDRIAKKPPSPSYLLPIKSQYFNYFELNDLMGTTNNGKPIFRMKKVGIDGVSVELRIPINKDNEYIVFKRLYSKDIHPDESKNEGAIHVCKISLGFLPFHADNTALEQRVGFIDTDVTTGSSQSQYALNFNQITEKGTITIKPNYETLRSDESKRHKHLGTSKYFSIKENYKYIEITKENKIRGLVIPLFPAPIPGSKKITFAIDFGTTNTHIEYAEEGEDPIPFNIGPEDQQLVALFDPYWATGRFPQLKTLLLKELIPFYIGDGEKYNFPMRTVVSEIKDLNHHQAVQALANINIPFHYEKEKILASEIISSNLKWMPLKDSSVNKKNIVRVEAFIETLLTLIRNKLYLIGGDLELANIVWFFPSSMSTNQVNQYRTIWKRLFIKHINSDYVNKLIDFSESEVPFYNHDTDRVNSFEHPVINIDIGGGTTDIVIFEKSKPTFLTSIKFAGNTVFGDAYNKSKEAKNGFVHAFMPKVRIFLEQNKKDLNELYNVFKQLTTTSNFGSADLMAFFFSLENNPELKGKNLELRLSEEISNHTEFNIVFILFYGAIIYHVAKLMKKLGLGMPRNICLSGNGSKIMRLLDADPDLDGLTELSSIIFEKVYQEEYHKDGLSIVQGQKPKEATCKGGIMKLKHEDSRSKFDNLVLLGDKEDTLINSKKYNYPKHNFKYEEVTEAHEKSTLAEINSFIDMLFDIHQEFDLNDNFGIDPSKLSAYKKSIKQDMSANLALGLRERLQLSDPSRNVAESIFFYPLVSSIYKLTQEIAKNK